MTKIYNSFISSLLLFSMVVAGTGTVLAHGGDNPGSGNAPQKTMPATLPTRDNHGNITKPSESDKLKEGYIPEYPEFSGVKYYEKWEIVSSRPAGSSTLARKSQISPGGFIKFLDGKHVQFRLNEFQPVQNGELTVTPQRLEFEFYADPSCPQCIKRASISRQSESDKEYLLEFDGVQQLFSINRVKQQK